jgi:hypothetical protein
VITLNDKNDPDERTWVLVLALVGEVEKRRPNMPAGPKNQLLEDDATIIMYDQGYKEVKGFKMLETTWQTRMIDYFATDIGPAPLRSLNKGKKSYSDELEKEHPGYLHKLYRLAVKQVGHQASFKRLARVMNNASTTPAFNNIPNTHLTEYNVRRFFNQFNGTLKSPLEKPYKTGDQKRQTLRYMIEFLELRRTKGRNFHVCFLGEKWYYTQSRCKKTKYLPAHSTENPADVQEFIRTTVSCRHPIKVMAM